jgi:YidC/Oxa1 family membrane protein insertase
MEKQSTLGFVLIGVILIAWMWLQSPPPQQHTPPPADTVHAVAPVQQPKEIPPASVPLSAPAKHDASDDGLGKYFAGRSAGAEKVVIITTDLYTAEFTTKGGLLRKWELHGYKSWDGDPVQLVEYDKGGDLSLLFTSSDGKLINTRDLTFDLAGPAWQRIELSGSDSVTLAFALPANSGGRLVKKFTLKNGSYQFGASFAFEKMEAVISNYEYQIVWEHGLRYAEQNSVDESSFAMAYINAGGELTEVDASSAGERVQRDFSGATDWVATRNKYFVVVLLPEGPRSEGAFVEGTHQVMQDQGAKEAYTLALKMPFRSGPMERSDLHVYLGPLEYDSVKALGRGIEQTMNLGAEWIIRPISEYVMIPLFKFLRMFIPNYGIVIIVFSIIIKIALHPLTRSSMKGMRKMQALTPLMNEIREKHKDDPQKMNAQVMNLYKEYGVNPAGGCLPLLLQMPILFALYSVFRSSIELRQANFVWWITDLSVPDAITKLPFTIPLFGMSEISGLAVAMGITMFLQQKMTVTDPRQKAMVYMMPVMMTLIFNSLPSGLNLYYFVFNILSIGQQMLFNRQHKDEPLRKVDPKKAKGGILARIAKDLPKVK